MKINRSSGLHRFSYRAQRHSIQRTNENPLFAYGIGAVSLDLGSVISHNTTKTSARA